MRKYKFALLYVLFCLFSVVCGYGANDTRLYNPNAKSPLLELSMEKRLELARKYIRIDYYWHNPFVQVLGAETEKWGLIDFSGNEVAPCMYDYIFDFHDGYASVKLNGKYGFIDKEAKEVVPCIYDDVSRFDNGLASVCLNGKWGVINGEGNKVIACVYDCELNFSEGVAVAHIVGLENGKFGYVDKQGKEVVPYIYDGAFAFNDGLARVYVREGETELWTAIDKQANEVLPRGKYDLSLSTFDDGMARVKADGKIGYVDKQGREVIPCIYDGHRVAYDDMLLLKKDGKWGFIGKDGKEIIPFMYDCARGFSDELAAVEHNGKWGFIDKDNNCAIPFVYDYAEDFIDGFAVVGIDDKYGCIDIAGNMVVPCGYDDVLQHRGCLLEVCKEGMLGEKYGIVDVTGKTIVPCRYDGVLIPDDEMFIAYRCTRKRCKCWLYDKNGKKVLKSYDEIVHFGGGFFLVEKRNMKCGVYDATGNVVVKARYDDILYHRDLGIFVCELENDNNSVTRHYYDTDGNFLGS